MPLLEAILLYRPGGLASEGEFRVASSAEPRALRAVADAVLNEARRSVAAWEGTDPTIAEARKSDLRRLTAIIDALLPPAPLRLVPTNPTPADEESP